MKSIVSYPDRGPWGNPKYRGNCSGHLLVDLLKFFKPNFFVDPFLGGGTSADVARDLGIRFVGLDLHSGFNLVRDSLIERLGGERPPYVWAHPPYFQIVRYSGSVWGKTPHPDDLSHCQSKEEFLEKMQLCLYNIYDALAPAGNYSILIGDVRKNGRFYSLQADLLKMMPGVVTSVVIKEQHNCRSDNTTYSGKFIPISHEYCILARKDRVVFGILDAALATSENLVSLSNATWKAVIGWALTKLGGRASLPSIYEAVAEAANERTRLNPHWQAKVRQVLQKYFSNVERGVWELRATA